MLQESTSANGATGQGLSRDQSPASDCLIHPPTPPPQLSSQQCGPGTKITYYPNELLEDLTTKFRFRKTSLVGLKAMIASQGTGVSK